MSPYPAERYLVEMNTAVTFIPHQGGEALFGPSPKPFPFSYQPERVILQGSIFYLFRERGITIQVEAALVAHLNERPTVRRIKDWADR